MWWYTTATLCSFKGVVVKSFLLRLYNSCWENSHVYSSARMRSRLSFFDEQKILRFCFCWCLCFSQVLLIKGRYMTYFCQGSSYSLQGKKRSRRPPKKNHLISLHNFKQNFTKSPYLKILIFKTTFRQENILIYQLYHVQELKSHIHGQYDAWMYMTNAENSISRLLSNLFIFLRKYGLCMYVCYRYVLLLKLNVVINSRKFSKKDLLVTYWNRLQSMMNNITMHESGGINLLNNVRDM